MTIPASPTPPPTPFAHTHHSADCLVTFSHSKYYQYKPVRCTAAHSCVHGMEHWEKHWTGKWTEWNEWIRTTLSVLKFFVFILKAECCVGWIIVTSFWSIHTQLDFSHFNIFFWLLIYLHTYNHLALLILELLTIECDTQQFVSLKSKPWWMLLQFHIFLVNLLNNMTKIFLVWYILPYFSIHKWLFNQELASLLSLSPM